MHLLGAFELDIRPCTPEIPAGVRVALQKAIFDPSARVFVSPECATYEEIEGQINSLQDGVGRAARQCPPRLPDGMTKALVQRRTARKVFLGHVAQERQALN
jgi:hypothetical protein